MHTTQLQVRKDQLSTTRLHTLPDQALADGQVRVCIDHFALTSNNITYAAFGDAMGYWQFFPTAEEGWGNIPVWGFASVVQSLHPGVAVGERLYGYWPMATGLVLQADLTGCRIDTGNPQGAELTLPLTAVTVGVLAGLHHRLFGDAVYILAPTTVTFGQCNNFLVARARRYTTFNSGHF